MVRLSYCVRFIYMQLTRGAGSGSEEVRNQVAGHLDSRTYRNNYQDQRITLDVASLVRGQESEDALIRKLNDIGTNADPDANVALSTEALERIASLPDVVSLQSKHRRLAETLRDRYGSIRKAPESEQLLGEYTQAKTAHRTRKEFHKARMRSQLRQNFFVRKNAAMIETQLSGNDTHFATRTKRKEPTLPVSERMLLTNLIGAGDIRELSMQTRRAAAVQAMADLCSRVELKRRSAHPEPHLPMNLSRETPSSKTNEPFPMKCHRLQCLFCIGDERLDFKDRTRIFSQQYTLGRHVQNHIETLRAEDRINCPHPKCKATGTTLRDTQHLKNHAQKEHGIRLQCH